MPWLDGIFNEEELNIETFIYSTKFQGSISGYIFKSGEKGIGYYKDNLVGDGSNIEVVMNKKVKKDNLVPDEDKPKRKLRDYQQFAKDQLAFLKQREDAKEEGEEKLKQKDLMKLVAKRWKLKKEGIDETEWDDIMEEEEE
jgi:hypothetical protein